MKTTISGDSGAGPGGGFRDFLYQELRRRQGANPRYSLRAFALHLGIDHSTLSQLLRARRTLTPEMLERLGARLGLERDAIATYVAHEARRISAPGPQSREVRRLTADTANLVADWYHWAILELVRLRDFVPDSRWIARVLGLGVDEVNVAVSRLLHLGLLEMAAPDRWTDRSGDTATSYEDFTRAAVQRLWEQVRDLSATSLAAVPPQLREHSATTIAVRTDQIPEALARLARFRAELLAWLDAEPERNDVYRLELGFFPVTRLNHKLEDENGPPGDAVPDLGEGS